MSVPIWSARWRSTSTSSSVNRPRNTTKPWPKNCARSAAVSAAVVGRWRVGIVRMVAVIGRSSDTGGRGLLHQLDVFVEQRLRLLLHLGQPRLDADVLAHDGHHAVVRRRVDLGV